MCDQESIIRIEESRKKITEKHAKKCIYQERNGTLEHFVNANSKYRLILEYT
jgi:hypothetical protein